MFRYFAASVALSALCTFSASAQANLTAETSGPGTVIHLAPSALAKYAGANGVANIQLKDGGTTTNYLLSMAEGKLDIASSPMVLPFLMNRGAGPYANLGKEKGAELASNIRVLYPFTMSAFFLYTYDVKGINSWEDLKGRKVMNGPPKGAATNNSRNLIRLITGLKHDGDYESVTVSWNQVAASMVDGTADAGVTPELFPSGRLVRAGAAGGMTAHSVPKSIFDDENASKFLTKPGSTKFQLPVAEVQAGLGDGWTVVSEDDTFRGMGVVGGDMVHKNMDEELAYALTKTHIDNIEGIKVKSPMAAYANFGVLDPTTTGLCGGNPVKFHPGSVRAWEEAGYTVPECAKP